MKSPPLFSIVEQLLHYAGELSPVRAEPRGGRIYRLDMSKADNDKAQTQHTETAKKEDLKVESAYDNALRYTKTCGQRFSYTELAEYLGVDFTTARKLLQKLSMGRHVIKDGVMGTNGAKDAYRGKKS